MQNYFGVDPNTFYFKNVKLFKIAMKRLMNKKLYFNL